MYTNAIRKWLDVREFEKVCGELGGKSCQQCQKPWGRSNQKAKATPHNWLEEEPIELRTDFTTPLRIHFDHGFIRVSKLSLPRLFHSLT